MVGTFYEFFAGGGMARAGLGPTWECLFANDLDRQKADSYRDNWGGSELLVRDVAEVSTNQLPGQADLAWASFPCQDLSLAGSYQGLAGSRSGTFWPFWQLMVKLQDEGRGPKLIVLENVLGALTSHGGKDFTAIASALSGAGYRFGAVVIDAKLFVPQSRPRLFIVAVRSDLEVPRVLAAEAPSSLWHPQAVKFAYERLPEEVRANWLWWALPAPTSRSLEFSDLIENAPTSVTWHTRKETSYLLSLMNHLHKSKVEEAIARSTQTGRRIVGGIYRRTREGQQRAEVRFDGVAGCLRTPAGGSSRQSIIVIDGPDVRTRLLSTREAARLMGLPDDYRLPAAYNQAYQLTGDGLVVPAVRHLAQTILEPLLRSDADELEQIWVAAQ